MKNLHDMLSAKEAQLAQIQKEVDALRIAAKILADESEKPRRKKTGAGKTYTSNIAEGTVVTQPLMIRSVLLDKGGPLHVEKIAAGIKKKYGVKLKPLYLTSIIYRIMKKGRLFRKEGANTFGLLEWPAGHQEVNVGSSMSVQ
jgi:hypothetical protein